MEALDPPNGNLVIFDDDPERLVKRITAVLNEKYADIREQMSSHDADWFLQTEPAKTPRRLSRFLGTIVR